MGLLIGIRPVSDSVGVPAPLPLVDPLVGAPEKLIGAWCVWACAFTPPSARIPLWSAVLWTLLLIPQLAVDPAAVVLGVAIVVLVYANVVLVLWRSTPMGGAIGGHRADDTHASPPSGR